MFPALRGRLDLRFEAVDPASLAGRVELAFTALPHAASARAVAALRERGLPRRRPLGRLPAPLARDLPAVVRRAPRAGAARARRSTGCPSCTARRCAARSSSAAPGCYPTSALLPLAPLLRAGLVETRGIHIDAKSGVSGAGRTLADGYLFAELDGNCHAYKPGYAHRHAPEIEQEASRVAGARCASRSCRTCCRSMRGIATSVYVRPRGGDAERARRALHDAYAREPFVRVLPGARPRRSRPCAAPTSATSRCSPTRATTRWILLSALDNLGKGASGQAVQCANLMCGLPETTGLLDTALLP